MASSQRVYAAGRKQESVVRDYFKQDVVSNTSECKVVKEGGTVCGRIFSGRNSTNAKVHLKSYHKSEYAEFLKKEALLSTHTESKNKTRPIASMSGGNAAHEASTSNLKNYIREPKTWSAESTESKNRDDALVRMVIDCGLPMSIVEKESFKQFCKALDDKYRVPARKKLNMLFQTKFNNCVENMKEAVTSCRRVTIGMNIWTKKSYTASYLGITVCLYHPKLHKSMHVLLNLFTVDHPHTGEMISNKLDECLRTWNTERKKIMLIVTDNGSNMKKAIKTLNEDILLERVDDEEDGSDSDVEDGELRDEFENMDINFERNILLKRLPCAVHTLQLVVKSLDKCTEYKETVDKARIVIRTIGKSSVATQKTHSTLWTNGHLRLSHTLELNIHYA